MMPIIWDASLTSRCFSQGFLKSHFIYASVEGGIVLVTFYETWLSRMWFVEFLGGALWCLFIIHNCFFSEEITNVFKSKKRKQGQNFISLSSMAPS